ncbi:hypothetical protein KHP62_05310 [Rhodobacteraceae bacterium NNCM2]|nr:hypothetical protein [Coraliihabitans acroporae]
MAERSAAFSIENIFDQFYVIRGHPDGRDWIYGRAGLGRYSHGMTPGGLGWVAAPNGVVILDAVERREVARHEGAPAARTVTAAASDDGVLLGVLFEDFHKARRLRIFSMQSGQLLHDVDVPKGQQAIGHRGGMFLISIADRIGGEWQTGLAMTDGETGEVSHDVEPAPDYDRGFYAASPSGRYWLKRDWGRLPRIVRRKGPLGLFGKMHRYGLAVEVWEATPRRYRNSIVPYWTTPAGIATQHAGIVHHFNAEWNQNQTRIGERMVAALGDELGPARIGRAPFPSREAMIGVAERAGLGQGDAALAELVKYFATLGLPKDPRWEADEEAFWYSQAGARRMQLDGTGSPATTLQRYEEGSRHDAPWLGGGYLANLIPQNDGTALGTWYDGKVLIDGAPAEDPLARHVIRETTDGFRTDLREAEIALNVEAQAIAKLRDSAVIKLGALDEEDCLRAIRAVQRKLTKVMNDAAAHGRRDAFRFETPEGPMESAAFYDHVARNHPSAAEPLEKLLASFERWETKRDPGWHDVSVNMAPVRRALETLGRG